MGGAPHSLGIGPGVLRAVWQVESKGNGFLPCGRTKILCEGHVFWRQLKARGKNPSEYAKTHPTLVYPKWTARHYRGGEKEYERLEKAMAIDRKAALRSTMWGAFQILGANYKLCGFSDAESFVKAQKSKEGQLRAFIKFLRARNLVDPLRKKDWQHFARVYNGPGYARYGYDKKLAKAYARCASGAKSAEYRAK